MDANKATIGSFSLKFTGYIDAVENSDNWDDDSEVRLPPPGTQFHVNYWQNGWFFEDFGLQGNNVTGANVNTNAENTWGNMTHMTIDDHINVLNGMETNFRNNVSR